MAGEEMGSAQHLDHNHYPVYLTRKGNYYWHCLECGEVRFFSNVNKINCKHNTEWKLAKTGRHYFFSCPICHTRAFKPIENGNL